MYEIWLMLNIAWELLKLYFWPVVGLALLWMALMLMARTRLQSSDWRRFGVVALIAFPVAVIALPWLTLSSIAEARYLLDWITLLGLAAGLAIVVAAFAVPASRLVNRREPTLVPTHRRAAI
jgi:hypothetical protein